jgi:hypothetical protein
VATAPPHQAGVVDVGRFDEDMVNGIGYDFEYREEAPAEYERVLVPLFTPPAHGQHGSLFATRLKIANGGKVPARVRGLDADCYIDSCPGLGQPYQIEPGEELDDSFELDGNPGKFIYVERSTADSVAVRLNVMNRRATDWNTERRSRSHASVIFDRVGS